jgi:hypothetical protein
LRLAAARIEKAFSDARARWPTRSRAMADLMALDTVSAIQAAASSSDRKKKALTLAAAHQVFRDGRRLFEESRFKKAEARFHDASSQLRQAASIRRLNDDGTSDVCENEAKRVGRRLFRRGQAVKARQVSGLPRHTALRAANPHRLTT